MVLIGCPNIHAAVHASELAMVSHVNLQSPESLKEVLKGHFEEVITFGMNDEIVHTGFNKLGWYFFLICIV